MGDGITHVAAQDKATNRQEKITITNDKGRLTQEEVDRMIEEAERFAGEDKLVKERLDARNAFDGYIRSMESAMGGSGGNGGSLSDNMDPEEKQEILNALRDGQSWLDANPEADADEIKEKQNQVSGICAPIVSKYAGGGHDFGDDSIEDGEEQSNEL